MTLLLKKHDFMAKSDLIFSVVSRADLGLERYFLDEEGYYHILLGHRDLKNVVIMGIEETVKSPTHVYKSTYDNKQYQFVSHEVVTARGHPMNVIIQVEGESGRVITATPKKKISGDIIWDAETGLYVSYDNRSDVLYFSHGDSRPSYADDEEDDGRVWLRFHEDDESPAGVTIFQAASIWNEQKDKLTARISEFLQVQPTDVVARVNALLIHNEKNA